jgi:hypothetical protein
MCKETTTTYKLCPCRIPSIDRCPRCPSTGYKICADYSTAEEQQKGICVGLGTCPAEAEVKIQVKGKEEGERGKEGVSPRLGSS